MILHTEDTFLDNVYIEYLADKWTYKTPHMYGGDSVPGGNSFYSTWMDPNRHESIEFIFSKIQKSIIKQPLKILRSYLNIQHVGMDGEFHFDDGHLTCLLMVSRTLDEKTEGGAFEYIENDKIKKIDFVQNRLIIFKNYKHRGCAPKIKIPRITLAYKVELI